MYSVRLSNRVCSTRSALLTTDRFCPQTTTFTSGQMVQRWTLTDIIAWSEKLMPSKVRLHEFVHEPNRLTFWFDWTHRTSRKEPLNAYPRRSRSPRSVVGLKFRLQYYNSLPFITFQGLPHVNLNLFHPESKSILMHPRCWSYRVG
jgi:hypothetical protein